MGLILLIIVLMLLFGVMPAWPHSRDWGYGPTSGLTLVLLILVLLFVFRVLPFGF